MRTRKIVVGLVAAVALGAPASSQAATKLVTMGPPGGAQTKAIQHAGGDVNDFFPHGITVHVGDKVKFAPFGFHTVDLVPKGGAPLSLFAPTGQKVSGANDAAGQPFWFNGQDNVFFNPGLFASQFGKTVSYSGSKRVESGAPLAPKNKPMTVKFTRTGSFTYYCNIHPGMKGTVKVKPKKSKIPSKKVDAKAVKTQLAAASKIFKTLPKKNVPANTVSVGSAGKHGVELYAFLPSSLTVPVGTTVNFRMSAGSYEEHTASTGPGDPEKDPNSYLGQIAASFEGQGPFDPRAVYPSEASGGPAAALTPTYHGNGFWNSGAIDRSTLTPTLPSSNSVTFASAGTYQFYCLIHPFMHGTVNVQ
jgi:plastocyanin